MISMNSPSLCVCIITYQRPKGLRRLLDALVPQIQGRTGRSVVVVNDGSHDNSYSEVIDKYSAFVHYHQLEQNCGVARARNEAVLQTDSDYVVFIDDDCLPPPFWLDWLAAELEEFPELDVVAGVTRPLFPDNPGFFAKVQAELGFFPNPERLHDLIRCVTANLAIRRKFFWELGGFRHYDNFPGAAEDTEISSRISRSDCFRRIDWEWYVFHDVGDGLVKNMKRYWRYGFANVCLHHYTISPPYQDGVLDLIRAPHLPYFRGIFKYRFKLAKKAFPSTIQCLLAALFTSLIDMAYRAGCRDAARQIQERSQTSAG